MIKPLLEFQPSFKGQQRLSSFKTMAKNETVARASSDIFEKKQRDISQKQMMHLKKLIKEGLID